MAFHITIAGLILLYFCILFAIACQRKNYAVADVGWGLGFVLVALYASTTLPNRSVLECVVLSLVALWGCRLSLYIYYRNLGKPEDFRYKQFRDKFKNFALTNAFFKLFFTQAIIMWVVSLPVILATMTVKNDLDWQAWTFAGIALFGFLYESMADWQLYTFKRKSKNKGKIMTKGLWRYSRHPNYLGEIIFWWGVSLLVAVTTGQLYVLVSGLTMNLLIVYVSGVPMLEKKYKDNPAYIKYMQKTYPLLPKWW